MNGIIDFSYILTVEMKETTLVIYAFIALGFTPYQGFWLTSFIRKAPFPALSLAYVYKFLGAGCYYRYKWDIIILKYTTARQMAYLYSMSGSLKTFCCSWMKNIYSQGPMTNPWRTDWSMFISGDLAPPWITFDTIPEYISTRSRQSLPLIPKL